MFAHLIASKKFLRVLLCERDQALTDLGVPLARSQSLARPEQVMRTMRAQHGLLLFGDRFIFQHLPDEQALEWLTQWNVPQTFEYVAVSPHCCITLLRFGLECLLLRLHPSLSVLAGRVIVSLRLRPLCRHRW